MLVKNIEEISLSAIKGKVESLLLFALYVQYGFLNAEDKEFFHFFYGALNSQSDHNVISSALNLDAVVHYSEGNIGQAKINYHKAIELGDSNAMTNLASLLIQEGNYDQAIYLYEKAIDKGNYIAMLELADLLESGTGIEINPERAQTLKSKAAPLQNETVKLMYSCEVNERLMKKLDEQIAKSEVYAMIVRANFYRQGVLGTVNLKAAVQLFKQATGFSEAELAQDIDLSEQLEAFESQLDDLITLISKLEPKLKKNPKKYTDVYTKAVDLQEKLSLAIVQFYVKPTPERFKVLQNCFTKEIDIAERTFKQHRGFWYNLNPIIRKLLGVLATISIIPAFAVALKSKHGYLKTFFSKPVTETQKEFSAINRQLKKEEHEIKEEFEKKGNNP